MKKYDNKNRLTLEYCQKLLNDQFGYIDDYDESIESYESKL